jgi:AcrR family transcriptional regulator
MPLTRSRPKTEEKFQNAILKLIADEGCGSLGINSVAQVAGADKVLIYRYFGNFKGLLQRVAESRKWLPTADEVMQSLPSSQLDSLSLLREIDRIIQHHIRSDASTHQLVRWRRTKVCPICEQFTDEWRALWQAIPSLLSEGLSSVQRALWAQACSLLSLTVEAELCGEAVKQESLAGIANLLEAAELDVDVESRAQTRVEELRLPTNLL